MRWRRSKLSLIRANGLAALERFLSKKLDYNLYSEYFEEELAEILQDNFPENQAKKRRYSLAPAPATQEAPHLMTMDRYGQPCDAVILRSEAWS